jgi:type II secretory pathway pseudopilin PulG
MVAVGIFCLIGSKQLLGLANYQRKVINARNAALKQIEKNIQTVNSLKDRYQVFDSTNPNIIGGQNTADTNAQPPNGTNSRIVLDALPSKYDFPALISSVYKIMANDGITSPSISATDQSLSITNLPSGNPQPVAIPLSVSGNGNYSQVLNLIRDLERSIRPFDITNLQLTGSNASMSFTLTATTYYQPGTVVDTTTKEIK